MLKPPLASVYLFQVYQHENQSWSEVGRKFQLRSSFQADTSPCVSMKRVFFGAFSAASSNPPEDNEPFSFLSRLRRPQTSVLPSPNDPVRSDPPAFVLKGSQARQRRMRPGVGLGASAQTGGPLAETDAWAACLKKVAHLKRPRLLLFTFLHPELPERG